MTTLSSPPGLFIPTPTRTLREGGRGGREGGGGRTLVEYPAQYPSVLVLRSQRANNAFALRDVPLPMLKCAHFTIDVGGVDLPPLQAGDAAGCRVDAEPRANCKEHEPV